MPQCFSELTRGAQSRICLLVLVVCLGTTPRLLPGQENTKSPTGAPAADVSPSPPKPAEQPPRATPDAPAAGHSMHGEAFNEGPRQGAYLMGGTGRVKFAVTTTSPPAQQFFEQGVGQLHGFWYWEAERSFRQAATIDPQCAMAYWGMAMANVNNNDRALKFIREAVKRKEGVSRRESLYIDA